MRFKSISVPDVTEGTKPDPTYLVVPNQSMSLEEILDRFTRGEPVFVGREVAYHESEDDLEKVSKMDLVDKEEYVDKLKQVQDQYDKQEKRKAKAKADKLREEAKAKIEAEEREKAAAPKQSAS